MGADEQTRNDSNRFIEAAAVHRECELIRNYLTRLRGLELIDRNVSKIAGDRYGVSFTYEHPDTGITGSIFVTMEDSETIVNVEADINYDPPGPGARDEIKVDDCGRIRTEYVGGVTLDDELDRGGCAVDPDDVLQFENRRDK